VALTSMAVSSTAVAAVAAEHAAAASRDLYGHSLLAGFAAVAGVEAVAVAAVMLSTEE